MREVYYGEKPDKESPSPDWEGSGGGSSGSGNSGGSGGYDWGWGGGGDSGSPESPEWGGEKDDFAPQRDEEKLRLTAGGQLMVDRSGKLLMCRQLCKPIPPLVIYLKRESNVEEEIEKSHTRCIQCNLFYTQRRSLLNDKEKTLVYDFWPIDRSPGKAHYRGSFPLPDPGEMLTVKLMWQKGHHDINDLSKMKIILFGVDSGWKTVSRSSWRTVATVQVDEAHHITVNSITGTLAGNKEK